MKPSWRHVQLTLFPPIPRRRAREIAAGHAGVGIEALTPWPASRPLNWVYNLPSEPFWAFSGPWNDGDEPMLRSSRVILISKETGAVLFDGSASDEG